MISALLVVLVLWLVIVLSLMTSMRTEEWERAERNDWR